MHTPGHGKLIPRYWQVAIRVYLLRDTPRTINATQDFDRRRVPTRGLDDVLVSDELKGKLDKVRHGFPNPDHLQQHAAA